jgi:hypothetical protein
MNSMREFHSCNNTRLYEGVDLFTLSHDKAKTMWTLMLGAVKNSKIDKKLKKEVESYLLVSESYWKSAINLPDDVSPLNLYYCYMNLLKATFCMQRKNNIFGSSRPMHGVTCTTRNKFLNANLRLNFAKEDRSGPVFNLAGELLKLINKDNDIKSLEVTLREVISSLQFLRTESRLIKIESSNIVFRIVGNDDSYWGVFRIPSIDSKNLRTHPNKVRIFQEYNEVKVTNLSEITIKTFSLEPTKFKYYSIFESKLNFSRDQKGIEDCIKQFDGAFKKYYAPDFNSRDSAVNVVWSDDPVLPEEFNAYLIFFYFSHLVRYEPFTLTKLRTNSVYGPMMRSFVDEYSIFLLNAFFGRFMAYSTNNTIHKLTSVRH